MSEIPAPLVPADCDLRDFAFMPLDVGRLRDSDLAANETPEACWAAVLLWATSWHQVPAASIPDDERWIAKQAGYAQRGKIAKEWAAVRDGALHGWLKCSDGRLYHPVVAEKAVDAWNAKLRQRWGSECARIKKHNQRHEMSLPCPTYDEWTSQGCPSGHSLPVPRDTTGRPRDIGGDKHSKGQGEGQGQGEKKDSPLPPCRGNGGLFEEPEPAAAKARKATQVPADYRPPDSQLDWLRGEAKRQDRTIDAAFVRRETEKFIDHHRSKGTPFKDHDGAWRNWMRTALERHRGQPPPRGPASDERRV